MEYVNKKLEEFNEFIKFRKVAIVGLGVSNLPLIDYLYETKARVTVFDEREIDEIPKQIMDKITNFGFEFFLGKNCLENLNGFTLIFRSPSCLPTRLELEAEANRGAIVTTEIEMLMKMCPCKIIGVTGSDGKTTTTSLINAILKQGGYNTYLGGNIGTPLFTKLSEMTPEDIVVLELSSFQLMGMEISPNIAVITNITPNHLNIHKDYEEYIESKKNIFKYQNKNDKLILNYDNDITRNCANEAEGKVVFFSGKEKLDNGYIVDEKLIKECNDKIRKHVLNTNEVILRGEHNFENIATAIAATSELVDIDTAVKAVKDFKPVEHRLEFIREIEGVKWYNDSVSSSPTRTIAGLYSFDEEIVLIAGGYDKNLDYTPIAKPIIEKVKTLILLGQTSGKIFESVKEELDNQCKDLDIYMCDNLKQTIELAKKVAKPGQIILFSPASASFDMFKNFADRGNQFKELVNDI
ncbi:MAG: UDP-N-acetylmuramoyl-L-alanine--D-glutamate ligase [Bacilli bacterium]|nr:UDP-N-acetylmuramoyl-L-alanine--D-glutamate ligase [Clostridia bacterium]MCI9435490.1 UDP-N-acetylmuramoyl-L-alanine--D-glutamate ligase [Bacilli bacterium]